MPADERPKPETASVVAPGSSNPPPGDPLDEMLESFGEDRPAYASVRRESAGMRVARYNADPHAVPVKRLTPSWPAAKVLVQSSGQGRNATTAISRRAPKRLWAWALCSFFIVLVGGFTAMGARKFGGAAGASSSVPSVSSSGAATPRSSSSSSSSLPLVPLSIVEAPSVAVVKGAVKAPEVKKPQRQASPSVTVEVPTGSAAESAAPVPVQPSASVPTPASSSSSSDISHIM